MDPNFTAPPSQPPAASSQRIDSLHFSACNAWPSPNEQSNIVERIAFKFNYMDEQPRGNSTLKKLADSVRKNSSELVVDPGRLRKLSGAVKDFIFGDPSVPEFLHFLKQVNQIMDADLEKSLNGTPEELQTKLLRLRRQVVADIYELGEQSQIFGVSAVKKFTDALSTMLISVLMPSDGQSQHSVALQSLSAFELVQFYILNISKSLFHIHTDIHNQVINPSARVTSVIIASTVIRVLEKMDRLMGTASFSLFAEEMKKGPSGKTTVADCQSYLRYMGYPVVAEDLKSLSEELRRNRAVLGSYQITKNFDVFVQTLSNSISLELPPDDALPLATALPKANITFVQACPDGKIISYILDRIERTQRLAISDPNGTDLRDWLNDAHTVKVTLPQSYEFMLDYDGVPLAPHRTTLFTESAVSKSFQKETDTFELICDQVYRKLITLSEANADFFDLLGGVDATLVVLTDRPFVVMEKKFEAEYLALLSAELIPGLVLNSLLSHYKISIEGDVFGMWINPIKISDSCPPPPVTETKQKPGLDAKNELKAQIAVLHKALEKYGNLPFKDLLKILEGFGVTHTIEKGDGSHGAMERKLPSGACEKVNSWYKLRKNKRKITKQLIVEFLGKFDIPILDFVQKLKK